MKITRPIRAVLFDMDGVMVDSEFVYMKYLLEFAKEKNPAVTMEDINPMVGRSRQDSWTVMERAVNNGESWESLIKEWGRQGHLQPDRLPEDLPPGDEDNGAGIKTQGIYRRTCIIDRTKADLQDR